MQKMTQERRYVKRWWICSLENDRGKNHTIFMPYSIFSKPGHELFLVNHRILHGILGFLGTWVLAILAPNSCKLWGSVLGADLSSKCSKDLFFFLLILVFCPSCPLCHCPPQSIPLPFIFLLIFLSFLEGRSLSATGGTVCNENQHCSSWYGAGKYDSVSSTGQSQKHLP